MKLGELLSSRKCECLEVHAVPQAEQIGDLSCTAGDWDAAWCYRCSRCGCVWLRVLFENPLFPRSGHWYDAIIPRDVKVEVFLRSEPDLTQVFSSSPVCFRGGSYFSGQTARHAGPVKRLV